MNKFTILFLSFFVFFSSAQEVEWAHKKSGYQGNGQVTIRNLSGDSINITNTRAEAGISTSSSPTVMTFKGGGSYEFGYGIRLTNGDYYMRETNLDAYIRMTTADFLANFSATEHILEEINNYATGGGSASCSISGSFSDPNTEAVNQGGHCSASISVTGQTSSGCNAPTGGGDRCYCWARGPSCSGNTSTSTGFCARGSISGGGAGVGATIPVLGGSTSCSSSGARNGPFLPCSAPDPVTISYSGGFTISNSASSWSKTETTNDGVVRGFGYASATCGATHNATSQWVMPDGTIANGYSNFPTTNIYWSEDEQVYVGWGGSGAGVFTLDQTGVGIQIGDNVTAAPAALLTNIQGI